MAAAGRFIEASRARTLKAKDVNRHTQDAFAAGRFWASHAHRGSSRQADDLCTAEKGHRMAEGVNARLPWRWQASSFCLPAYPTKTRPRRYLARACFGFCSAFLWSHALKGSVWLHLNNPASTTASRAKLSQAPPEQLRKSPRVPAPPFCSISSLSTVQHEMG